MSEVNSSEEDDELEFTEPAAWPASILLDDAGLRCEKNAAAAGLDGQTDPKVIAFVVKAFPDVQSLSNILPYILKLQMKMRRITDEMVSGVCSVGQAQLDVTEANTLVQSLGNHFTALRDKCEEADQTITPMVARLKPLDNAKRHLTAEVTTLKQVRFLVHASILLKTFAENRQYIEAAHYLNGCNQTLAQFVRFTDVPKLNEIRDVLSSIVSLLRRQIFDQFSNYVSQSSNSQEQSRLQEACQVVEALGSDVRRELIGWFIRWMLDDYHLSGEFQAGGQSSSLEKVEKRYAWFRNLLQTYSMTYASLFPSHWNVEERLAVEFCTVTRNNLNAILDQRGEQPDDGTTLFALQKTIEFEQEMLQHFRSASVAGTGPPATSEFSLYHSGAVEEALRLERVGSSFSTMRDEISQKFGLHFEELQQLPTSPTAPTKFMGIISSCFEKYVTVSPGQMSSLLSHAQTEAKNALGSHFTEYSSSKRKWAFTRIKELSEDFRANEDLTKIVVPGDHHLNDEHLHIGSFESLLLCVELLGPGPDNANLSERMVLTIRTQMGITSRQQQRISSSLRIRPLSPDSNRRVPSVSAVRPHLHYRLLLLKSRRPSDFDRRSEFKLWQDRQISLYLHGLVAALKICRANVFRIRKQDMDSAEIATRVADMFSQLKAIPPKKNGDFDEETYTAALRDVDLFVQYVYKAYDKACRQAVATRYMLSIPYPLNLQMYERILRSCYPKEDSPPTPPENPAFLAALSLIRHHLNISTLMHDLCVIYCLYRHHTRQTSRDGMLSTLAALKKEIVNLFRKDPVSESERSYFTVVLGSIREQFLTRLSDYHRFFGPNDPLLPKEAEVYILLLRLMERHTTRPVSSASSVSAADEERDSENITLAVSELSVLIIASVCRFYDSIATTYSRPIAVENLIKICDAIGEQAEQECKAYAGLLNKLGCRCKDECDCAWAGQVSMEELCRLLSIDVGKSLAEQHALNPLALDLLNHLKAMRDYVGDLGRFNTTRQASLFDLSRLYGPLVSEWLQMQHQAFSQCLERTMQIENWKVVDEQQRISSSVVDLFTMFSQTLPFIFDLDIPLPVECINTLALSIDGILQKYAQAVVRSCGPRSSFFPQLASSNRLVAFAKGLMSKDKEAESKERVPMPSLEELLVRLNDLHFANRSVERLGEDMRRRWDALHSSLGFPMQPLDDKLFSGVKLSLEACWDELIKLIAAKVVYVDLRPVYFDSVYMPSPSEDKKGLEPVLDLLSQPLSLVRDYVKDELMQVLALNGILRSFVECLQRVLLDSGNRTFSVTDYDVLCDDIKSIEEFWIARDSEGVVHGLDEQDVLQRTRFVRKVINTLFQMPTKDLIGLYASVPESSTYPNDPMTSKNVVSVLRSRNDPMAKSFVRQLSKKSPTHLLSSSPSSSAPPNSTTQPTSVI